MRDAKRLAAVRLLPCVKCGHPDSQAAHSNWSEHGKGRGIKANDQFTIPLCMKCHQWLDQYQYMNRDDQEFAETCKAIAMLKQNECEEYKTIAEQVIRLCSTTKLSVKQMTEYLNNVHDFTVTQLSIHLIVPDDLKWCYEDLT